MGYTLTINGVPFKSAEQICYSGCAGPGRFYSSDDRSGFGPPPLITAQEYDDRETVFPGVDDVGIKRFGRRTRTITVSLIYVYATKAACEAAIEADFKTNFVQLARYTITMPGGTALQGCRLVPGGAAETTWGPPLGGSFVAQVRAVFKQYSLAN